jgi:hypothetical protein
MRNRSWQNHIFAAAIIVALAVVAHAELRALLLVADALGLELVVLLVVVQIRALVSPVASTSMALAESLSKMAKMHALRAIPCFVAYRPLALSPLFGLCSYANYVVYRRRISIDVRNG